MSIFDDAEEELRRLYRGWTGIRSHPRSPTGGGGAGNFRHPGVLGMEAPTHFRLPHPDSPAARHLTSGDINNLARKPQVQPAIGEGLKITVALLKAAESSNTDAYYQSLLVAMNTYAVAYSINSPLRIAHFLAQIGHESKFRMAAESGHYAAKRMRKIFGCKGGAKNYDEAKDDCKKGRLREKLWTNEELYAGNSKNLLGYVYALRLGNGDEASNEGYKFRGRGMMQLTGKSNYRAFSVAHNKNNPDDPQDFVASPDLVTSSVKYGVESAFYFWDKNGLNEIADKDDVLAVTTIVNGGTNGLDDRKVRLKKVKEALGIK